MTRRKIVRYGFWAVLLILAIVLIRSIFRGDDSSSPSGAAEIVTVDELREIASSQDSPIYWAGAQAGTELELRRPGEGRTYLRYLAEGAGAGAPQGEFLTVGTYAFPDATAALKRLGGEPGGVLRTAPGGATVYFSSSSPENVYLAYPGVDLEIEIFDPEPKRALSLATSGQIVPIG